MIHLSTPERRTKSFKLKRVVIATVTVLVLPVSGVSQTRHYSDSRTRYSQSKSVKSSMRKASGVPHPTADVIVRKANPKSGGEQQLNNLARQTARIESSRRSKKASGLSQQAAKGQNPEVNFQFQPPKGGLKNSNAGRETKVRHSAINRRVNGSSR